MAGQETKPRKWSCSGPLKQMDLSNNAVGVQLGSSSSIVAQSSTILSKVLDAGLD
jgi:hypothetical protein